MKFSVLMSLYKKENPIFFERAFKSCIDQTVMPNEIVIILDGKLTPELYERVDIIKETYHNLVKIFPLKKNVGLGKALQEGVIRCSYEYIARMDTDDIAVPNRFEVQLNEFRNDPSLDLVGGGIIEFETETNIKNGKCRMLPIDTKEIYSYAKKRNPFNHMTVMFKKSSVLNAGNYQSFPSFEDYFLWIRMIKLKMKLKNLNNILVWARVGNDMISRRGGWSYFISEYKLFSYMRKENLINYRELYAMLFIRMIARVMPNVLRRFIYNKYLRESQIDS